MSQANNNNNNNVKDKAKPSSQQNEFLTGHIAMAPQHYKNRLPPVPFDPKMLQLEEATDMKRKIGEVGAVGLEKKIKYEILINNNLGVKLDLINPHVYTSCPDQPIDADDQILIEGRLPEEIRQKMNEISRISQPESSGPKEATPVTQRASYRPDPKDIPWLRKFDYLTSEMSDERAPKQTGRPRKTMFLEDENSRTADRISETFEQAQNLPKHPTKPNVIAKEIYEIFPNFEMWPKTYHSVIFDRDPELPGTLEQQQKAKSNAILKNYPRSQTGIGRDLLVYLIPQANDSEKNDMMDLFGEEEEDQPEKQDAPEDSQLDPKKGDLKSTENLEWIRPYNVDLKNRENPEIQDLFLFALEGEKAHYNPIFSRFSLQRTPKATSDKFFKNFHQPEKISLKTYSPSEERKKREENQKLENLFPSSEK